MTKQQSTMFPIRFNYNGVGYETKALKYPSKNEVLYKIALPSAVSLIQQYWISKNNNQWKLIIGSEADQQLLTALTTAIKTHENIVTIYTQEKVLKSA